MSSTVVALIVALFGVTGTLLAPVLAQRSQAKAGERDFQRQQQAAQAQWEREQRQAELAQRRSCYIATNAAYRRYRIQLMHFLWCVHRGNADEADRQQVEDARHAHHAAFAEAQMIASQSVLHQLDLVAKALSISYSRIMLLEEGHPAPGWSFEEIHDYLQWIWERWKEMRSTMRADLGLDDSSPE